ncbi:MULTISPECIES: chromate transporter [Lacrimispora]|jgi:chromate transporter|uniref:chromate transporter n=1 Tax=Lacrimispora TaxID=2719231 RepID=UPI000BE458D1|nr:chromate transporter [Lacrimispora amygdalina]MDK2964627.1 chromate transporter [Lacrimispora sp.]
MNKKKLCKIFLSTLYLSSFTFGGGYVIVTLLKKKFVDELHWIDQKEMLDLVAIAQSSPGAIAVNGAVVVGYKLAGIPGILCAVAGAVIPPFVLLTIISFFYNAFRENLLIQAMLNGMKAGVGAVIISVVYDMGSDVVKEKDPMLLILMAASFLAAYYYHVNVIFIILAAALAGTGKTILRKLRSEAKL